MVRHHGAGLVRRGGFTDSRPIIELGSPLFSKATTQLGNKKQLVVEAKNTAKANVYVQAAELNGKPLANCWLYRDELMRGGRLVFTMGPQPNKAWCSQAPPPLAQ